MSPCSLNKRFVQSGLKIVLLCLGCLFFFPGCGYHLKGGGDTLPKDITTIAILPFTNNSGEADIEALVSSALYEEFSKQSV